jgi:hypothetical protein
VSNKLAFWVLLVSLGSSACTIDVRGEGRGHAVVLHEQRHVPVTGRPEVLIQTFDGSIQLRSWDRNEIRLDIERSAASRADAEDARVEVTEQNGQLRIVAKSPGRKGDVTNLFGWMTTTVRLNVTLPRELNVEARTGDGAIDARGLSGRVELRTGDGSVRIQHLDGQITVETGDGAVLARDIRGAVVVNTGDGSVQMSGRFDDVRAQTGDGAIGIDVLPGSKITREWTLTTGDGSVTVRVPSDFNADMDARTGDGSITTRGIRVTDPDTPEERRRHVRGLIGTGGELLTLRTGDGGISVVAR